MRALQSVAWHRWSADGACRRGLTSGDACDADARSACGYFFLLHILLLLEAIYDQCLLLLHQHQMYQLNLSNFVQIP